MLVICGFRGPYREIFPKVSKTAEAEDRGKFLRPRKIFSYTNRPKRQIIGLFFLAVRIFLKQKDCGFKTRAGNNSVFSVYAKLIFNPSKLKHDI